MGLGSRGFRVTCSGIIGSRVLGLGFRCFGLGLRVSRFRLKGFRAKLGVKGWSHAKAQKRLAAPVAKDVSCENCELSVYCASWWFGFMKGGMAQAKAMKVPKTSKRVMKSMKRTQVGVHVSFPNTLLVEVCVCVRVCFCVLPAFRFFVDSVRACRDSGFA